MPIDKITPRQLDADSDGKLLNKASMLDALNLYSGDSDGGNKGVLKNIKGNLKVPVGTATDVTPGSLAPEAFGPSSRVIGSVIDPKTGIAYLFVYSTSADRNGVWAYDPEGKLSGDGVERVRLIYRSKQFGFSSQGFVKGDVVHVNKRTFQDKGAEFEKDAIIYFTDGINEPRKINAYRAFESSNSFQIHGTSIYDEADFITACPKAPVKPITFEFNKDESRSVSNFKTEPGFQFAYQNIYIDGFESAISCYSDVAFPPTIISQGSADVDHSIFNRCVLTIPKQGPEIDRIKILGKKGNSSNLFVIDEIKPFVNEDYVYHFFNDRVVKGVPSSEVNKQFDNVPKKAKAQSVTSNRLMYGDYVEGYDNVPTSCTATIHYADRPNDFVDIGVTVKPGIFYVDGAETNLDDYTNSGLVSTNNKAVGFELDFNNIPDSYSAGDTVNFSISIAPDRNWHLYNKNASSYHQSPFIGAVEQESPDGLKTGLNVTAEDFFEDLDLAGEYGLDEMGSAYLSMFGKRGLGNTQGDQYNDGYIKWKTCDGDFAGENRKARIGSSAGAPLIFKGAPVSFTANFSFENDTPSGGRGLIAQAISDVISARLADIIPSVGGTDTEYNSISFNQVQNNLLHNEDDDKIFHLNSRKDETEVNINLGLTDGTIIPQSRIGDPDGITSPLAKLIVAVGNGNYLDDNSVYGSPPIGYFIVNKADIVFNLEKIDNDDVLRPQFRIGIKTVSNVDAVTCMHPAPLTNSLNNFWIVATKETLSDNSFTISSFLETHGLPSNLDYALTSPWDATNEEFLVANQQYDTVDHGYLRQIGYLDFSDNEGAAPFYKTFGDDVSNQKLLRHSLLDGEGGPGGGKARGPIGEQIPQFDEYYMWNQGSVTIARRSGSAPYVGSRYTAFWRGSIKVSGTDYSNDEVSALSGFNDHGSYFIPSFLDNDDVYYAYRIDFKRLHPFAEISTLLFFVNQKQLKTRSFKTSANHDFGIVYYDERGRSGFVNPLKSVYVPGYSNVERNGPPGAVSIDLKLEHAPPSWAHNYKIAYSKNTSAQDFVQYSAGGAFVHDVQDQEISQANQNIYVSLNYLQGHPISYSSSFGARSIDGGMNFYKFQEGDKLRIISYDNIGNREYLNNYDFEVIGTTLLGDTENPLALEPASNQKGQFLILRNNPFAFGFNYTSVASSSDHWKHNCIFEVFSPFKTKDSDERIYYEMSETGDVIFNLDGNLIHDPSTITLDKGDVWFRKVPVNLRDQGQFEDLIFDDDGEEAAPSSNFKDVYLETMSANDLIESNSVGFGRPNFVLETASEVIRESSITYSDPTDASLNRTNYSSFNLSNSNFKDLSENYGNLTYIANLGEYLIAIQENKTTMIPVNRGVLSDASGSQSLISSKEVLGDSVFLTDNIGSDSASSVVENNGSVFFADKSSRKIIKANKAKGVQVISDKGVASLIRAEIQNLYSSLGPNSILKIIGGYDPVKEEYLVTLIESTKLADGTIQYVTQPQSFVQTDTDPEDDDGDSPITGINVTDQNNDGFITVEDFIQQQGLNVQVAGEGQTVIDLSLQGLENAADYIAIEDSNNLWSALYAIGSSVSAGGDTGDNEDVLTGMITAYAAANNIDPSTPEGVLSLFEAAGLEPTLLPTGGTGEGTVNLSSNRDLLSQILQNGESGWSEAGQSLSYQNLRDFLNNIDSAFSGNMNQGFYADLDRSADVGTSDLLLFLSTYGGNSGDLTGTFAPAVGPADDETSDETDDETGDI